MKLTGFLLLVAGWLIVLAAMAMLRSAAPMAAFVLAGVAVEALGLALAFRAHMLRREEKE
jgi:Skp family chaperone for outer membrane proteins